MTFHFEIVGLYFPQGLGQIMLIDSAEAEQRPLPLILFWYIVVTDLTSKKAKSQRYKNSQKVLH